MKKWYKVEGEKQRGKKEYIFSRKELKDEKGEEMRKKENIEEGREKDRGQRGMKKK